MDKKTIEDFIEAFAWFGSNTDKIVAHLKTDNGAIKAVANWFTRAYSNPQSFTMVNGFIVSSTVIRRIYCWNPINPEKLSEARDAIQNLFPSLYQ